METKKKRTRGPNKNPVSAGYNAQAQRLVREKKKAYIENLERENESLKKKVREQDLIIAEKNGIIQGLKSKEQEILNVVDMNVQSLHNRSDIMTLPNNCTASLPSTLSSSNDAVLLTSDSSMSNAATTDQSMGCLNPNQFLNSVEEQPTFDDLFGDEIMLPYEAY